ncbi:MAG: cytochrome c oxidase accessory protein CcoG, partial [Campylobacter sp.]|nr:cytochrome c oxidase accessory protein CcoG [Campylobacter sp.]
IKTRSKVKYFRFRTIGYMVALSIAVIALGLMTTKKEHMLLNINRATQLYSIKVLDDNTPKVQNAYTFLIQNTDNVEHAYYFDVNETRIKIDRPLKPITLKAGGKKKVIVVLSTTQTLVDDTRRDTPIDITINAYAKDAKETISVDRKTIFVYPKQIELEKAIQSK